MWLRQLLSAVASASAITSALSIPLPQPDTSPDIEARGRQKGLGWPKYFHEPGDSMLGAHYDSRYHHGIDTYEDRRSTQSLMIRAYFTFFIEKGMETWLAHGTLLGWWWNGKMLPWDWDIDTQVSESTLRYMGIHHNGTMYEYVSVDDPTIKRTYLLDVNPAIIERDRGNGNNVIDARFIDTSNGLYIDITGLSETHPEDQPGIWSCKNYHRYHTTDLYPMRETVYEGVTAKVPYAYDRLLTQEYTEKALVVTEYEGHRWNPDVKEWIKKTDEELKAEREAKYAARLKQKVEKQRIQQEKNRQKEEAAKQEKSKQEETAMKEKIRQGEDAKQELAKQEAAKVEGANKQEAAKLEAAMQHESKQQENKPQESPQQASPPQENKLAENPPQSDPPQPNPPQPNPLQPNPPQEKSPQANPPQANAPQANAPQQSRPDENRQQKRDLHIRRILKLEQEDSG